LRFVSFCANAVQEFLTNNCMQLAAAIAFYSFFCFFPLVLLVIIIASFFLTSAAQQVVLAEAIGGMLPVSPEAVGDAIKSVVGSWTATGPVAFVGLLWASTAVFGSMRKGINAAWNIKKPRAFLKERIMDFSLVVGFALLFLLANASNAGVKYVQSLFTEVFRHSSFSAISWSMLSQVVPPTVSFLTFSALYKFIPNTKVRWREVWFGAIIASLSFEGAKYFFFFTSAKLSSDTPGQLYGPLTTIMVLLGWLYVSAAIMLVGALISAIYTRLIDLGIVQHRDVWSLGLTVGINKIRKPSEEPSEVVTKRE